ncbi:hypothetical protein AXG93_3309s1010 [Marchantia polymorpha subsp. ruderalis]|uniref:Uncharacterized protein n=1 Tax=Marchantia polymorpha subsp. ruderalis TaxID=1480154 RepID=A0A176W687_MARPO|nr:hypothetical protein AXG93_3309s1010 [Marchantia polymorpha subsp. ruderalis]
MENPEVGRGQDQSPVLCSVPTVPTGVSAFGAFGNSSFAEMSSAMRLRHKQKEVPSAEKQEIRVGGGKECAGTCKKFNGPVHPTADGFAESAADWPARISERADCGEARFPLMGMELDVSGDGEEGHLLFECETLQVTKEEEISFGALFKNSKSIKNGYKTRDYKDRLRKNVTVTLLKILQPHRTTYMTSWQVGFVEQALSGAPIHWARILWKATRQHAQEEKWASINHLSPFLINFYRPMECLTATEQVQFPLLSRSNPSRYVKDVEVDTDTEETPACTSPNRPRAEEEPRAARVPRKRKWDEEAEQSQREASAAPGRSRAIQDPSSRPKQKARKLVLPASSADIGRAAEKRNSPSSEEDASARASGRTADLPPPKARTPSEEARTPSNQGRRQAAPTRVPATDRCFASEQVPFDDSTSGQESSAQAPSAQETLAQKKCGEEPSAQGPSTVDAFGGTRKKIPDDGNWRDYVKCGKQNSGA